METFVSWFYAHGGTLDTDAMALADIPGCGRGAVALKDLPVGVHLSAARSDACSFSEYCTGKLYIVHDS